jgi:hypothetical protein
MKGKLSVAVSLALVALAQSFLAPMGRITTLNRAGLRLSSSQTSAKFAHVFGRKSHTHTTQSLQMQATSTVTAENPLKVIVAGGGVGGLCLAKALQKKGCKVTVLEKTSKFARFGGPIQLASNALATIKGIDENLFDKLMKKFTFTGTRTNGIKDGIRSTSESPQWYTKFEAITNMADYFSLPYTGVVDRPDLQVLVRLEI